MLRTMLNHHLVFVFLHKTFRVCKKSTCFDLSSNLLLIIRNYAKYRLYISYIQIIISDTLIKDNVIIGINGINMDNTFFVHNFCKYLYNCKYFVVFTRKKLLTFIFNLIDTPGEYTIIREDYIGHVMNLLTYIELRVNPITHFDHNT